MVLIILAMGSAKAVSDGAVIWHCSNFVTARRTRLSYGIEIHHEYNVLKPEHRGRPVLKRADGARIVDGAWSTLIEKVRISSFRETYDQNADVVGSSRENSFEKTTMISSLDTPNSTTRSQRPKLT